ncbi:MAG: hypothetical protein JXR91_01295, partial [Deltaproteobacteria bacterium]|nr:hypothetical protein [Deltaproteobacteria bacterium]
MSLQFFLIIAGFWILKPLKKTIFIEFYDKSGLDLPGFHLTASKAELIAKNVNMVVAFFAMVLFVTVSKKLKKEKLLTALALFSAAAVSLAGLFAQYPSDVSVFMFYSAGDLFNMLLVAGFFAFLNDSVSALQAKKLYGTVIFGGVAGGVAGSTIFRSFVNTGSLNLWIFITLLLVFLIIALSVTAGKYLKKNSETFNRSSNLPAPENYEKLLNTKELQKIFKSKYILSIGAIVGLYELVSTIIDYQFTSAVASAFNGHHIGEYFGEVYLSVNIISLLVQLLLTGTLLKRAGVLKTVMALPVALIAGTLLFALAPVLYIATFLCISDNALNYSINQSAKETLYTVIKGQSRYTAKGFTDIFVQRSAKAAGVNLTLVLSMLLPVRWLAVLSGVLIFIWIQAAKYAGSYFEKNSGDSSGKKEENQSSANIKTDFYKQSVPESDASL